MNISADLEYKNYYVEGLYMSANVETGVLVNRSGRRMIALTNDFLLGLHRALEKECGDRVSHVLHHCGRKWGKNFGIGLDGAWSEFYGCPLKDFPLSFFQSLLVQEFAHNGWGQLTIDYSHFAKGVIVLTLVGAIMADISDGEKSYPADVLTAGIFAGLFSHFTSREVDCLQSQCARTGHGDSRFLLSDPGRVAAMRAWATTQKTHQQLLDHLLV